MRFVDRPKRSEARCRAPRCASASNSEAPSASAKRRRQKPYTTGSPSGASAMRTALLLALLLPAAASGQILDKQKLLEAQTFWDNRDWDWYKANIPFFECPDADITTTYYYRWELLTKHLTYGSPNTGYTFTEFIDRPFWSGTYGAISCPAGHQLYEARWLRDRTFVRD